MSLRTLASLYKLAVLAATASYVISLRETHGLPAAWTMSAGQQWLADVAASPDFFSLFFCAIFAPLPRPYLLVLAPLCIAATYAVGAYASRHLSRNSLWTRFAAGRWSMLQSRQSEALVLMALCEIGLGLSLVLQMLSPSRSILTCFVMWNFLKMRYTAPPSRAAHGRAWQVIGSRVNPYLDRVQILKMPLGYLKNWFTALPAGA